MSNVSSSMTAVVTATSEDKKKSSVNLYPLFHCCKPAASQPRGLDMSTGIALCQGTTWLCRKSFTDMRAFSSFLLFYLFVQDIYFWPFPTENLTSWRMRGIIHNILRNPGFALLCLLPSKGADDLI